MQANSEHEEGGAVASVSNFWHWLTTSRYTRLLEEECARLRADNIALRASVFGLVGRPGQTYAGYLAQQLEPKKTNGESKLPGPARRSVTWGEIRKRLELRDQAEAEKVERAQAVQEDPGK